MKNKSASNKSNEVICPQLAAFARLLLRVTVGAIFLQAGWMKFQNPAMIQGMLAGINFPLSDFFAWIVIFSELIGGALLVLGLWTKYATIPLMIVMLVAFFTVHLKDGLVATTWYVMMIFFALSVFFTSGAGKISLDNKLVAPK